MDKLWLHLIKKNNLLLYILKHKFCEKATNKDTQNYILYFHFCPMECESRGKGQNKQVAVIVTIKCRPLNLLKIN